MENGKIFKKYGKIWLITLLLTLAVCALYRAAVSYVVESWVIQNGGDLIAPEYLDAFAERTEKRLLEEKGKAAEEKEAETDDLWSLYYQTVNDKVQPSGFVQIESSPFLLPNGGLFVYDLATVMWIADRDGNIVLTGEYSVFGAPDDFRNRVLVDLSACFSEEEMQKLTQVMKEAWKAPTREIYMTRYVVKDDICYPMTLEVTWENWEDGENGQDGQKLVLEGKPDFDLMAYEIVTDKPYRWLDEPQDAANPDYQEIKQYTRSVLGRYVEKGISDYNKRSQISMGRRNSRYLTTTQYVLSDGEYLLCKGEISNYGRFLKQATVTGWGVIAVFALLIALGFTLRKRGRLQKAEYERAVTNALTHDYKSSLMIQRGYAENLLYGVSEDKKRVYEQKIIDEIDKMDIRTERLLSLFRLYAGNVGQQPVPDEEIDAAALCRELLQGYAEASKKRGLTWKLQESGTFILRGDKVLFSIALDNLLNNACKYSLPDSEIRICIMEDSLTIANPWQPVEKFLKKPALFWEPYVTGEDARTSRNSGIGLSAARQILQRMHIKLSVKADSEEVEFMVKAERKRTGGRRQGKVRGKTQIKQISSIFLLLGCTLVLAGCDGAKHVRIPAQEVKVERLYHYQYDGTEGVFLLVKAPTYSKGGGCEFEKIKDGVNLDFYYVAKGKAVNVYEGLSYQWELSEGSRLEISGQEVWTAESDTASQEAPAYVLEAAKCYAARKRGNGEAENYTFVYDAGAEQVSMIDGDGAVKTWDMDGTLLYTRDDSYREDPYWSR